jgi:hypothetical protein
VTAALDGVLVGRFTATPDGRWAGVVAATPGEHSLVTQVVWEGGTSEPTPPLTITVVPPPDPSQVTRDGAGRVGLGVLSLGKRLLDVDNQDQTDATYKVEARAMPANQDQRRAFTLVREKYLDPATGTVHGSAAVAREQGTVPNQVEEFVSTVPYGGRDKDGRYPHDFKRLKRVTWVESGYVRRTPNPNCEDLATDDLKEAFDGQDFSGLRHNGKPLRYCTSHRTAELDTGDLVTTVGALGSPEGWVSQLRRAKADLEDFLRPYRLDPTPPPAPPPPPDATSANSRGPGPCPPVPWSFTPVTALAEVRCLRNHAQHADQSKCKYEFWVDCTLDIEHFSPDGCDVTSCPPRPDPLPEYDLADCWTTCVDTPVLRPECTWTGPDLRCRWVPVQVCTPECRITGWTAQAWFCEIRCEDEGIPVGALFCEPLRTVVKCSVTPPVTGYLADHTSGTARSRLEQLAEDYENVLERQVVDGQYVNLAVDPRTTDEDGYWPITYHDDGYQNSAQFTGLVAAARAFKYQVTGDLSDLDKLRKAGVGLYVLMTIASEPIPGHGMAPRGIIVNPDAERAKCRADRTNYLSDACPADGVLAQPESRAPGDHVGSLAGESCGYSRPANGPRVVWPRAFAVGWFEDEMRPEALRHMYKGYSQELGRHLTYGFEGYLPGLSTDSIPGMAIPRVENPGRIRISNRLERYRINMNPTKDNVDGMMYGALAVYDALPPEDAWLKYSIGDAVGGFMNQLVFDHYRMRDIDGAEVQWGKMLPRDDDDHDPTCILELLSWLKICEHVTRDTTVRERCGSEYRRVADAYLGGVAAMAKLAAMSPEYQVLFPWKEFLHARNYPNDYRPFLIFSALDVLMRLEAGSPDDTLRRYYAVFAGSLAYPAVSYRRNPLVDAMYLKITGQIDVRPNDFERDGDSLRGRIAGVLAQYPSRRMMFRGDLPDGGSASCPERRQRLPGCETSDCYKLSYQDCSSMNNPFTWLFSHDRDADTDHAKAVWALGQSLVPVNDVFMKNRAYALREEDERCVVGGFHELHAYDYLLSYWYARRMNVLRGP